MLRLNHWWQMEYPGDAFHTFQDLDSVIYLAVNGTVTSLPVFIQNILNCVLKTNEAFTGSERHGVSDKWQNFHFGVEYHFKQICFLQTSSFWLRKTFIAGLELLMDYCDVFFSCLDPHSDGTHSLQRIHWWASDAMLHFSRFDEEINTSTSWIAWGWAHIQQIFTFGWTTPLTSHSHKHS